MNQRNRYVTCMIYEITRGKVASFDDLINSRKLLEFSGNPFDRFRPKTENAIKATFAVTAATDLTTNQDVFVKKVGGELTNLRREKLFLKLLNEIFALLSLPASPNFPALVGFGFSGSDFYIVTKAVSGLVFDSALNSDLESKLVFVENAALSLSDLEKVGIIHRDIHPANVLFGKFSSPLIDFDCAQVPSLLDLETKFGKLGASDYCAPERIANLAYDARSDVFSLGVVASKLLGTKPANLDYIPPHSVRFLLSIALSVDPNDRFANASDFAKKTSQVRKTLFP